MNNALQKTIPRFFIGSFFIALLCAVIISEFVGDAFFLSFLISFIPGVMTTLIFFVTREKASSYYCRYFLLALLMPFFLIPILTTLFDLIYLNSWHDAIDTLVEYYLTHGILACILGVAQLVLAQACFIKIWDAQ